MNDLGTKLLPDGMRIEAARELVDKILLNMSDPTDEDVPIYTYTVLHRPVPY